MTSDQEQAAPAQQPVADIKTICTSFFRWWYNQPGANTDDGFDAWAFTGEGKRLLAASSEPELRAEIVSLTRERDEAIRWRREVEALSEEHLEDTGQAYCYVGIRDYAAMRESVEALSAEVGKLTEANLDLRLALTPFSEVEITRIDPPDSEPVNCKHINGLFYGHFREARAALDKGATG